MFCLILNDDSIPLLEKEFAKSHASVFMSSYSVLYSMLHKNKYTHKEATSLFYSAISKGFRNNIDMIDQLKITCKVIRWFHNGLWKNKNPRWEEDLRQFFNSMIDRLILIKMIEKTSLPKEIGLKILIMANFI